MVFDFIPDLDEIVKVLDLAPGVFYVSMYGEGSVA